MYTAVEKDDYISINLLPLVKRNNDKLKLLLISSMIIDP